MRWMTATLLALLVSSLPSLSARPLFYVLAARGRDFAYFRDLAGGHFGEDNTVGTLSRKDAANRRASILRVEVGSPGEVLALLSEGRAPSAEWEDGDQATGPVWKPADLVPTDRRIAGFMLVSHAASDAAFVGGERLSAAPFVEDRQRDETLEGPSFFARLLPGSAITFFGCNSGNCHCDDELPSIAHSLAALYGDRKVVLRGKYNTGDVNSDYFATFRADRHGVAHRVGPAKGDYDFFFEDATRAYRSVTKKLSSPEERESCLAWYRQAGIAPLAVSSTEILVALPTVVRVTRDSAKDPVLVAALRAMAAGGEVEARARDMLPGLSTLFDDGKLRSIVHDELEDGNGRLDVHAFRLWYRVYYRDFVFDRDCYRIVLQACPCDDEALSRSLLPEPLENDGIPDFQTLLRHHRPGLR